MSEDYAAWIGREEAVRAPIHEVAVQAMAATLDLEAAPAAGRALPAGWQWLFFNPAVRRSELGTDGHPRRGGFLPPIALPRRMWAGSRIRYHADLPVGAQAERRSRIAKVENKTGRRGALWFVTVEHQTRAGDVLCIEEAQDIVYREATPPGTSTPAPTPAGPPPAAHHARTVVADTTLLFRYSALTFNGHRIHYDLPYARDEEGYPGLVVHGPLTATLLQGLAVELGGGPLASFDFRGVSPLFAGGAIRLEGWRDDDGSLTLRALGPAGELAMSATARLR